MYFISCNVSRMYSSIFVYIDDITLLSSSINDLNVILTLHESFAITHKTVFNKMKTKMYVKNIREEIV